MKTILVITALSCAISSCGEWFGERPNTFTVSANGEKSTTAQKQDTASGANDDSNKNSAPASVKLTNTFKQGGPGTLHKESMVQDVAKKGVLDILVVIDNSGSMIEEQTNLSTKLAPLLSAVQSSDWQIAIVTTDSKDGCLRKLIKKNDANVEQTFATAVQAGINGSGNERGILMSVVGLKGSFAGTINDGGACADSPWLRTDSAVAVLIVSDEDNCSDGLGCGNDDWGKAAFLTNYLSSIRSIGTAARVYGLITPPNGVCKNSNNKPGNQYAYVVEKTGGVYGNICDSDYSATLNAISNNAYEIVKNQMILSNIPDAGSLKMLVDNVEWTSGFTLNQSTITFSTIPAAGAKIEVQYMTGSKAVLSAFELSKVPVAGSIVVTVNGVQVSADKIAYDSATNSVKVSGVANFADVRVEYDTAATASGSVANAPVPLPPVASSN